MERKVYKTKKDVFKTHKNEKGEDVYYCGQVVLQQLLDILNLNISALAHKIGWERPDRLYRIKDGVTQNISADIAIDICRVYKHINMYWLITGDGEKYIEVKKDSGSSANSGQPDQHLESFLMQLAADHLESSEKILSFFDARSEKTAEKNSSQLTKLKSDQLRLKKNIEEKTGKSNKAQVGPKNRT